MSFCYSGCGVIKVFEGVCGIVRVFLVVGVCLVLVLLWVNWDDVIFSFLESFYFYLVDGRSFSEVLNKVMKCLWEFDIFNKNEYWVLFVFIGDDVMLEFLMKFFMWLLVSKVYGLIFIL